MGRRRGRRRRKRRVRVKTRYDSNDRRVGEEDRKDRESGEVERLRKRKTRKWLLGHEIRESLMG